MSLFLSFILLAAQAAPPSQPVVRMTGPNGLSSTLPLEVENEDGRVAQALDAIANGRPQDALSLADQVISEHERQFRTNNQTMYFSARSLGEGLIYATLAMSAKKKGVVLNGDWATAYFLKGFALIDLRRPDEAIKWLDKAAAVAPMNSQVLSERAEWYKARRDWKKAYKEFESARSASNFTDESDKASEEGRAIRGMAFVRIEQGKLDDAERLLGEALKLNPSDTRAREELSLIARMRSR